LHEAVSRNHECAELDDLVEFAEGYLKEREPFMLKLGKSTSSRKGRRLENRPLSICLVEPTREHEPRASWSVRSEGCGRRVRGMVAAEVSGSGHPDRSLPNARGLAERRLQNSFWMSGVHSLWCGLLDAIPSAPGRLARVRALTASSASRSRPRPRRPGRPVPDRWFPVRS
jgi:hypothetical protein